MKSNKIFGLIVVVAVICLSIGNAVTGHGIKGNVNLNMAVLADGSSGSGSGSGSGDDKYDEKMKHFKEKTEKYVYYPSPRERCEVNINYYEVTCEPSGNIDCEPGTEQITKKNIVCEKEVPN